MCLPLLPSLCLSFHQPIRDSFIRDSLQTHLQEEVKHELEPIKASWKKSILQNLPTYFLLAFEHWNSGLSNTWYKLTLRLTKLIIRAQWQIVLSKEYNKSDKNTSTWYTGKKTLIYYWEFTNSPLCHVHLLGAKSFKQILITWPGPITHTYNPISCTTNIRTWLVKLVCTNGIVWVACWPVQAILHAR
jgi:hypothetical protein